MPKICAHPEKDCGPHAETCQCGHAVEKQPQPPRCFNCGCYEASHPNPECRDFEIDNSPPKRAA